jgi:hypothetical protein
VGCPPSIRAQNGLENLVYTVGTVTRNNAGQDWAFLMWNSPDVSLVRGRTFVVYAKDGEPSSPGSFTKRGIARPLTDAAAINAALGRTANVGESIPALNNILVNVWPLQTSQTSDVGQRLAAVLSDAISNPTNRTRLELLARISPGVTVALGLGWAEPINPGVTTTFELRELDPATGEGGTVVGRVILRAGQPVVLPRPEKPVQVHDFTAKGDLNVRLRWGETAELRRLWPLGQGFNVWRLPKAEAESRNWHTTAPSLASLRAAPGLQQINDLPVAKSRDYGPGDGPGSAADFVSDPTTWFTADDNRKFEGGGFGDGEEFYYFITARDILGREGEPSIGGYGIACRRLPPPAPTRLIVENDFDASRTSGQEQLLRLNWRQNVPTASDPVTHYAIYRWTNFALIHSNEFLPSNFLISVVPHIPAATNATYLDSGPAAPQAAANPAQTFWYTVRAVNSNKCNGLFSPNSAPAFGVLRQREGPEAPDGQVATACAIPMVVGQDRSSRTEADVDPGQYSFRLICERSDAGIAWARFTVTNAITPLEELPRLEFGASESEVSVLYSFLRLGTFAPVQINCIVGSADGTVSAPAIITITDPPANTNRLEVRFRSTTFFTTALSPSDPNLQPFLSQALIPVSVEGYSNHMVRLNFPGQQGLMLIQHRLLGAASGQEWQTVGTAGSQQGIVVIADPGVDDCRLFDYRGFAVRLPPPADCEHNSQAGDGSTQPVCLSINLKPRTREVRVYRCLDDGPRTLIRQSAAIYVPGSPVNQICIEDNAMPSVPALACYYVQLFDEHGNGSRIIRLGRPRVLGAAPPTPTLAPPESAGTVAQPQVALRWFCQPSGVERFWITLTPTNTTKPPFQPNPAARVRRAAGFSPAVQSIAVSSVVAKYFIAEKLETGRVGGDFGPGPNFSFTADVEPGVDYLVTVQSVYGTRSSPASSPSYVFRWKPPLQPAQVPWPARPWQLLGRFDDSTNGPEPRVRAVYMVDSDGRLDRRYPVGIRIGQLPLNRRLALESIGQTNFVAYLTDVATADPNNFLFKRISANVALKNQPLLPIVVYRQQVPNTNFARVSGDIVQVTPMIESLPWYLENISVRQIYTIIPDRLIAAGEEYSPPIGTVDIQTPPMFYVRDSQPMLLGAKYHYYVVRFNDLREIAQILDAGEIELPPTL